MFPREGAESSWQALEVAALLSSAPLTPLLLIQCCCFFFVIVTSLAPRRHERINTRKTLIIESCPDDDLVNLEFLDEVRFKVFMSLCASIALRYSLFDYPCMILSPPAGDDNQAPAEEVRRAAGVHLRRRHPHRSQPLPESQHLLAAGWSQDISDGVRRVGQVTGPASESAFNVFMFNLKKSSRKIR